MEEGDASGEFDGAMLGEIDGLCVMGGFEGSEEGFWEGDAIGI